MANFFEGIKSGFIEILQSTGSNYDVNLDANLITKSHYTILVSNNSTSSVNVNLPSISALNNKFIYIKDVLGSGSVGNININSSGSEKFEDNTSTKIINTDYGFYSLAGVNGTIVVIGRSVDFAKMQIYELSGAFI